MALRWQKQMHVDSDMITAYQEGKTVNFHVAVVMDCSFSQGQVDRPRDETSKKAVICCQKEEL